MSELDYPDANEELLTIMADNKFWEANSIITKYIFGHNINDCELEEASANLTDYALKSGDRLALSIFIVAYSDFLNINKSPPMPMLKGLGDVLEKYRQENISMNEAFNLSRNNKGNPGLSLGI
jgi:hypothetical protein